MLASSCAGHQGAPAAQSPATASSSANAAGQGFLPDDVARLNPAKVNASALPAESRSTVWTLDGTRVIGLHGTEGGCTRASAQLGTMDQKAVHVTLVETKPRAKTACTMDLRHPVLTVNLGKPLGDRTVVFTQKKAYTNS